MTLNHHKYGSLLLWALLLGPFTTHAETDCSAVTEISQIECESLLQLYNSTDGSNWTNNDGWNVTNTPCSWYGITCENNGVVGINFGELGNRLNGKIPNFSLPNLQTLSLNWDQITGEIPDFSGLPNLQILSLYNNQLTGKIPDFSALPNLQELNLGSNQLTGSIPDFSGLPNLQTLSLQANQLTGEIPNFSRLPNLQKLELFYNQLTGTIPDFTLSNLRELYLSYNQLTGTIPDFSGLPNLNSFDIGGNQLTGTMDCNMVTEISQIECESLLQLYNSTAGSNWTNNHGWNASHTPCSWDGITCENNGVVGINLSGEYDFDSGNYLGNNLVGTIPDFSSLPNLEWLSLSGNQLNGEIPDFSGLPNLQVLNLGDYSGGNQLTGEIPDFSGLPNLQTLYLTNNQLTGAIPDFNGLPNLQTLFLFNNELMGTIPDFSGLPNLQELDLGSNRLIGEIPNFSGLPNLYSLYLSENKLTGKIHDFNGLPNLWGLVLHSNQLTGQIPDFSGLPNLEWLSLGDNQLTGKIPDFSGLPNLQVLSLSDNQLTGEIPNFSGWLNLTELELDSNQLTGTIPDFSGMPNLRALSLSNNQLTGATPDFSGMSNLQRLNIEGNQLPITDCNVVTEISQLECESLLKFYHSTNGKKWYRNIGWNVTNKPCRWYGITCENNSVVGINFHYGNNLVGTIPDFSGLHNLQALYLDNNQLTGTIPDFSALPNLNSLDLGGNQLTGTIDCQIVTEISQVECESLLQLYHSTDGPNWRNNDGWNVTNTPCSWYGITCENNGVVKIHLGDDPFGNDFTFGNDLSGNIPDFSGLPNLQILDLGSNQLTGEIPDFNGLPNLQTLFLQNNQLTGPIPDFSSSPDLERLYLEGNQLTAVQILLEKESYHPGENFKAELTETFSEGYDLYVAVLWPNGVDFIALENTNQFAPLNQPQKWLASRMPNEGPMTLLDLTLPADLATGQYCLYGILSPENESVLEVADEWVMDSQCVEVNSTN